MSYRVTAGARPGGRSLVAGLFLAFALVAASPGEAPAQDTTPSSNLSVSKSGPAWITPDDETIEYTLSVANAGPNAASNVTLQDTLPGTTKFVSLTPGPGFTCTTPAVGDGGAVTCTSASLASGDSSTLTLVVMVPEDTPLQTEFTNTAVIASETSDPAPDNNSSSASTWVLDGEPGTVGFVAATYTVDEDAGLAAMTVSREDGLSSVVGVGYSTQDGTATAGSDYVGRSARVFIEDSRPIFVEITDDAHAEADETVEVTLSNPTLGAKLGAQKHATLTILDDDAPPPPVNQAPVASGDTYSTREGESLRIGAPGVLKNDRDPDGDSLAARTVSSPRHGRLTLEDDGSFVYTPDKSYSGNDSFTYGAADGEAQSNAATVRISVTDAATPTVRSVSPKPSSTIRDARPTIRATVKDNTTLGEANIRLKVAGRLISAKKYIYVPRTGALVYHSPKLSKGKKTAKIVATDAAGNALRKSWYFKIER